MSRARRVLLVVLAVVGALVVAIGGLGYVAVHRHLETRGGGVALGAAAPAFTLPDATGASVTLGGLTAHGPAVLVFYRGYW